MPQNSALKKRSFSALSLEVAISVKHNARSGNAGLLLNWGTFGDPYIVG
jgi:hypothetical protein